LIFPDLEIHNSALPMMIIINRDGKKVVQTILTTPGSTQVNISVDGGQLVVIEFSCNNYIIPDLEIANGDTRRLSIILDDIVLEELV